MPTFAQNTFDMEATLQTNRDEAVIHNAEQKVERRFIPRERLSGYLSEVSMEDIPWAVNFLVRQLAQAHEPIKPQKRHAWEDYKLSSEIEALSSFERTALPIDYHIALKEALEEKNR